MQPALHMSTDSLCYEYLLVGMSHEDFRGTVGDSSRVGPHFDVFLFIEGGELLILVAKLGNVEVSDLDFVAVPVAHDVVGL